MKTIVVSGGAGFIGSHICETLLKESSISKIICIDNLITGNTKNIESFIENPHFSFYNIDITEKESLRFLEKEKIDEIYHLASIASPKKYKKYPIETLHTNVLGTINMLDLCKFHQCKLLFTSTSEVYGDPLEHPQKEEYNGNVNPIGERSCYDESKRVAETYLYEYKKKYGLDVKIVRLFNTYGPRLNIEDGRVITNFIHCILECKPLQIYGSGNQTRSFCYVSDTVDAILRMMKTSEFGPINIGNPDYEMTITKLVEILEEIVDSPLEIEYIEKSQDDPMVRKPDITRAINLLKWKPVVELKEGLIQTLNYFITGNE